MKIILIIQDDTLFLPITFQRLVAYGINFDSVIILKTKTESKVNFIKKNILLLGFRDFFLVLFLFILTKFKNTFGFLFGHKCTRDISRLCHINNIPCIEIEDINSYESVQLLSAKSADLLLSLSAPQIFSEKVLCTVRLGSINLHGSYLPHYRGLLPSFWYLYNNEKKAGVTVHEMGRKIDSGRILSQVEFKISEDETQFSLIRKSKKIGAYIVQRTIKEIIGNNQIKRYKYNDYRNGTYYSWPEIIDVLKSRKAGNRFLTFRQILNDI